ncbi:hypothetical protein VHEMI07470 [[Torrubiella] hemipterigena]|uniref:Uncharacterized protein n=1 Tax=[Torrubiella] hemipterigena TaxID=1531966 RepID=A0A0A1TLR8_9HYPO|nr:hypothetical protein VHEMI07470 [[Torrubiella] hemipterigena]
MTYSGAVNLVSALPSTLSPSSSFILPGAQLAIDLTTPVRPASSLKESPYPNYYFSELHPEDGTEPGLTANFPKLVDAAEPVPVQATVTT